MSFTGKCQFSRFSRRTFTILISSYWLKRSIGWTRGLLQQFQKEPSITFHSENYKQKGVSFFVISTTNSCLFLQKRADTFFPELFRSRRLKSAFDSFDFSSWQPQCETFDVITRWQRSNLHPLISRIMTSTLYSTSFNIPLFLLNYAQIFVTIFIILYLRIIYSILLIHNLFTNLSPEIFSIWD